MDILQRLIEKYAELAGKHQYQELFGPEKVKNWHHRQRIKYDRALIIATDKLIAYEKKRRTTG